MVFISTLLFGSSCLESEIRANICPRVYKERSFFTVKKNYKSRQQEVNSSPWPILSGFGVFSIGEGVIGFFHGWHRWIYCLMTVAALMVVVRI